MCSLLESTLWELQGTHTPSRQQVSGPPRPRITLRSRSPGYKEKRGFFLIKKRKANYCCYITMISYSKKRCALCHPAISLSCSLPKEESGAAAEGGEWGSNLGMSLMSEEEQDIQELPKG